MTVICAMTHWSMHICEDLISSKKFGIAIAREACAADRLVVVGDYESANSLNFYQPLQVEVVDGAAYALHDDPGVVLTKEKYFETWRSPERVFLLVPKDRASEYGPKGIEIMTQLHRVLLRNH